MLCCVVLCCSSSFFLFFLSLSRGALCIDCVDLHVIVAATHCFDKSLMDTVIQSNENPIEKVQRSSLFMAGCIHEEEDVTRLIKDGQGIVTW